jgi:hypothetical protein
MTEKNTLLTVLGFRFGRGGTHTSRTMMSDELKRLLSYTGRPEIQKTDYLQAIVEDNCLSKRSRKNRNLTFRHLADLYTFDPDNILFRTLLYFWNRDIFGQPLLALLCTYIRDPIFRSTAAFILDFPEGSTITREAMESFLDDLEPGRFSKATLKSTAQNINSTWTQSGHLEGRSKKIRVHAHPSAGSISYVLLIGYLTGVRGQALFKTEFIRLLDCSFDKAIELAETASRKGWIVFKRIGNVIEVLFPNLINEKDMEWLNEQN